MIERIVTRNCAGAKQTVSASGASIWREGKDV